MDFYKSLVPQIEVIVVIGRTINLEKTARYGKLSQEFFENSAICLIHPSDSKRLGMKEGNVKITTKSGSIVVKTVKNEFETSEGIIVIPNGPWANRIIDESKFQQGQISFKAYIETTKEEVLTVDKLLQKLKEGS
ncbi:MAG TPA: molybdopterin dinucleotide binding domain-containing protein [Candidatus Deferrimicrobium sp.]|nr:molybdopterin dinucleotide binding domain-containing protein [Candidatus Deferrimicrobium sp.]